MGFSKKIVLMCAFYMLFIAVPLFPQQYRIQSGDKLIITFWQQPDLNTVAIVNQDGTVELPIIGRIMAAGFTSKQLSDRIVQEISRYNIQITQASIVITEFEGNKIYVTGAVSKPGGHSFEVIPNLWKVLQEAGGPLESANLEKITIIRGDEQSGDIIEVDLTEYFARGKLTELPKLHGGDTVHVPAMQSTSPATGSISSPFLNKNEIYIFGEVVSPGRYNLEKNTNLLDALNLAGGPTQAAKLSEVKILKRNTGMVKINLNKYINRSEPGPLSLFAGDTVFVPRKKGIGSFILTRLLVPIATSAVVFTLFYRARR